MERRGAEPRDSELPLAAGEAPDERRGPAAAPLQVGQLQGRPERGRQSWAITKLASTGAIVMRFMGPTPSAEVFECLAALNEMMPGKNANIIFDLRELHGHNPETKQPFKNWLLENKPRIGQITLVLPKAATINKMAAAVISLATGITFKIRDDLDERAAIAGGL